jgi:hypothetical protein
MDHKLFKELYAEGLISEESFNKIEQRQIKPMFSVHWEVKTLIFIGIVLLTSGLGILVYKNIDTIGHQVILIFLALVCAGCFVYCFKHKKPFSKGRVPSPNTYFDYVLLLGTICFLIFTGYIQYQYNVFGNNYGMATFIPMLALFYIAYDFDHIGILNVAIANLALWMGVSVTPKQLLAARTFDSQTIIFTYIALGLILLTAGWLTGRFKFKDHFKFSYWHYGVHVSFISLLAGYFHNYDAGAIAVLWLFAQLILAAFIYYDALKQKSLYFLVITVLYSYVAISSLVVRLMTNIKNDSGFYLVAYYFIFSAVGLIFLLIQLNKKIKSA